MRNRLVFVGIGILVCGWMLSAMERTSAESSRPAIRSTVIASLPEAKDSKSQCLDCHGPFDKLIESSDHYVAPSGEKTSPHRYVPHDSKQAEDIPECTKCHTAHSLDPLPTPGSVDLSKVNVQWCYETCHHEKNFTSCKTCHA